MRSWLRQTEFMLPLHLNAGDDQDLSLGKLRDVYLTGVS